MLRFLVGSPRCRRIVFTAGAWGMKAMGLAGADAVVLSGPPANRPSLQGPSKQDSRTRSRVQLGTVLSRQ